MELILKQRLSFVNLIDSAQTQITDAWHSRDHYPDLRIQFEALFVQEDASFHLEIE